MTDKQALRAKIVKLETRQRRIEKQLSDLSVFTMLLQRERMMMAIETRKPSPMRP